MGENMHMHHQDGWKMNVQVKVELKHLDAVASLKMAENTRLCHRQTVDAAWRLRVCV
jgi:hypothetical protein